MTTPEMMNAFPNLLTQLGVILSNFWQKQCYNFQKTSFKIGGYAFLSSISFLLAEMQTSWYKSSNILDQSRNSRWNTAKQQDQMPWFQMTPEFALADPG